MKQKLIIFVVLAVVAVVLAALNFASYSQRPREADSEFRPNRSTFNSGATGTSAYYALLAASGVKTSRFGEPPSRLLNDSADAPSVFIVAGEVRKEISDSDAADLLTWVRGGGRLVLIDRAPSASLLRVSDRWKLSVSGSKELTPILDIDPSDSSAMTANVRAAVPSQPSTFVSGVNAIQHSIFASEILFEPRNMSGDGQDSSPSFGGELADGEYIPAPVTYVASKGKNLVVSLEYGAGRVIYVSDPYIVSNAGIALADNAQLALNIARTGGGSVAFDEFHQGYGANSNRFIEFFEGTPVVAIFLQLSLLAGLILYTSGRRFARPLPVAEPDRLSKLEYVSAMASLQRRSRAYDLAIENIYRDFRRRAARLLGLDSAKASSSMLAGAIAARIGDSARDVEHVLDSCEQIIYGDRVSERRAVELAAGIRRLENALGLTRQSRSK